MRVSSFLEPSNEVFSRGFTSGRPVPTLQIGETRVFIFLRLFRDLCAWFSQIIKALENERTTLTRRFYIQEKNGLTVLSEQPCTQIIKEQMSVLDILLYKVLLILCENYISEKFRISIDKKYGDR